MNAASEYLYHAISHGMAVNNKREARKKMGVKIWRATKSGKDYVRGDLFHDACFDDDEGRDDFELVEKLSELDDDDSCESCGANLFGDEDEDEDEEPEPEED